MNLADTFFCFVLCLLLLFSLYLFSLGIGFDCLHILTKTIGIFVISFWIHFVPSLWSFDSHSIYKRAVNGFHSIGVPWNSRETKARKESYACMFFSESTLNWWNVRMKTLTQKKSGCKTTHTNWNSSNLHINSVNICSSMDLILEIQPKNLSVKYEIYGIFFWFRFDFIRILHEALNYLHKNKGKANK